MTNIKNSVCVVADWEAKERQAEAEKEEAEFNKRRDAEVRENHLEQHLYCMYTGIYTGTAF